MLLLLLKLLLTSCVVFCLSLFLYMFSSDSMGHCPPFSAGFVHSILCYMLCIKLVSSSLFCGILLFVVVSVLFFYSCIINYKSWWRCLVKTQENENIHWNLQLNEQIIKQSKHTHQINGCHVAPLTDSNGKQLNAM